MKTILVIGGGGFIGSNVVAALARRENTRVVVCDRFGQSDKWRNLVKHAVWEIIAPDKLEHWLDTHESKVEAVIHLGGNSSTTERDVDLLLEFNVSLSLRIWRWCAEHHVRFMYASSVATYGDGSAGFDDNHNPDYLCTLRPLNAHGWTKHLFDMHVAMAVVQESALPPQWVGLKFFNAYGPNEYHKGDQQSVVSQIAPYAIHNGVAKLFKSLHPDYADGEQLRDVVYVKDMTKVMCWMLDHPEVNGLFNLGTGKARSFNDMANAIFSALGREPRISYVDMPESIIGKYQYFTEAKMDKLSAAGYTDPFMTLEEGITDYVQNYLTQKDQYL